MTIKAIIFDVDDTILSTSKVGFNNLNETAERLGLKRLTWDEYLKHWGHPHHKMVALLWPGFSVDKFFEVYKKIAYGKPYPLIEGARETLEFFKKKNMPMGILTSRISDTLPKRFKQVDISFDYFRFIQYANETEHHKPAPRVFEPILKKFKDIGIRKDEILYVGDHVFDAMAALDNNLHFVGVLTGVTKKEDFIKFGVKENNILESVKELPKWFENE